ncbi:MAG: hypothetical protein WA865_17390 [Spirulinaceae cyanobacterium]
MLEEAFNEIRRQIDQVLEALGQRLRPDGELAIPGGGRIRPGEVDDINQGPRRIEGGRQGRDPSNQRPRTELDIDTPPNYVNNQAVREQWQNWPERVRLKYLEAQERIASGRELVRRMSESEYEAIFAEGRGTIRDVFISGTEQTRVFSIDRVYQFSDCYTMVVTINTSL